jgi:hypothetical protein
MKNTFEYWDVGDRKWKRRLDEMLQEGITVKKWFQLMGIRVR